MWPSWGDFLVVDGEGRACSGFASPPGVTDTQAVPREWSGFRAFLQSDFQATRFWFKHAQLALNFTFAATFVLLSDGLPWQQVARAALNLAAVLAFSYLLVCLSVRVCVCAMSEYSVITRARCGDAERVSLDDGVASCASPGVAGPSPTV